MTHDMGAAVRAEGVRTTIAIITRNRKDELRRAVRSALDQTGSVEVLVIDDGSSDGTSQMLRREFPEVRVVRFEDDADVAARRNDAAALASGDVIVSIDDDAVFSSPRIVADTLRDLDHPRIAAVAIPFVDVGISPEIQQQAPDREGSWVTTIFRATAYAIRRDVLVEVGGYTREIGQFGEEFDLSLKLLDSGYVIRLGRSAPIHHHTSVKRNYRRMDIYYRRNDQLICWMYFPFPWNLLYMGGYALRGIHIGLTTGRLPTMAEGVAAGLGWCMTGRVSRRPINRAAFRFDRRSRARARAGGAMRLAEADAALGPSNPSPQLAALRRPRAIRVLHLRLRQARTRTIATIGRPVRCEVCGAVLFRGLPFIWRGRLKLLGAESLPVRVDWDKMNRMTFRHVELDQCQAPWAS